MKVAFVISDFPRVSETFILNQIRGLLARGHQITIIAEPCPQDQTSPEALGEFNDHWLKQPRTPETRTRRTLQGLKIVASVGLTHPNLVRRALSYKMFGHYALSFASLKATLPFIKQCDFDVVHAHFGPAGVSAAMAHQIGAYNCPLLTTFYGHDVTRYPKQHGSNVYSRLFQQATRILALDPVMAKRIAALGARPETIAIQPLMVDCDVFKPNEMKGTEGPIEVLSVGRFVEKKGFHDAIRAFAKAYEQNKNMIYRLVGYGPLDKDLRDLAKQLGVHDAIDFAGKMSHSSIVRTMQEAQVLLAPSIRAKDGDEEGTPTVIIEALACGIPVVTTNHSGIGSLISDGETGWIVNEGDIDGLATSLQKLLPTDTRIKMGSNARAVALERFAMNRLIPELENHYQDAIDS